MWGLNPNAEVPIFKLQSEILRFMFLYSYDVEIQEGVQKVGENQLPGALFLYISVSVVTNNHMFLIGRLLCIFFEII
jgi:hypothetical protein